MPLIRNVSTMSPAFPGGRFSGELHFPGRAFVSSVSNGSRRTTGFFRARLYPGGTAELPEKHSIFGVGRSLGPEASRWRRGPNYLRETAQMSAERLPTWADRSVFNS